MPKIQKAPAPSHVITDSPNTPNLTLPKPSLGQIAYEAYQNSSETSWMGLRWHECGPSSQLQWEAAGKAVAQAVARRPS